MKKYLIILTLFGLGASSCASKLDIAPPNSITDTQLVGQLVNDPSIAEKMTLSFPARINIGNGNQPHMDWNTMQMIQNLRAQDMVYMNVGDTWLLPQYRFRNYQTSDADGNIVYWFQLYQNLSYANEVLTLLDKTGMIEDMNDPRISGSDATAEPKKTVRKNALMLMRAKATALTLRAWSYYYLMAIYSESYQYGPNTGDAKLGVPWITEFTPFDPSFKRETATKCWANILKDASDAATLFVNGYTDTPTAPRGVTTALTDFDANVANVILARAAIQLGNTEGYTTALAAANAVITANPNFIKVADYMGDDNNSGTPNYQSTAFNRLERNPEAIIGFTVGNQAGVMANSANSAAFNGYMNVFADGGQGGSKGGYMGIDARLYSQMDDNDVRKKNFLSAEMSYFYPVAKVTATLMPYFNTKFGAQSRIGIYDSYKQDICNMRSSEMWLIKAECQYFQGDIAGAQATLSALMSARTLDGSAVTVTETGTALFDLIKLQNRIELWGENGFEFYNNKRWGLTVDRSTLGPDGTVSNHPATGQVGPKSGKDFVFQIPKDEMNYNPNMTNEQQNP